VSPLVKRYNYHENNSTQSVSFAWFRVRDRGYSKTRACGPTSTWTI
jgi:hypothetical protein